MAVERVFVYGTLMPGQSRWPSLEPFAAAHQPATAKGVLYDTGRGYPAAVFPDDAGAGDIPGVVVMLDPKRVGQAIALLDAIEGEGSLYARVTISTTAGDAISYEWLASTDGFARLPDGWQPTP
ncbi:MAG: gamma-glutamylcyclotransferase family protein [Acidimicrobiales bacterium]